MSTPLPDASRKRSRGRIGFIIIAVLTVAAVLYFLVAPAVQRALLPGQLAAASREAYAQASARIEADQDQATAKLGAALRREPAYSASYDICYADHQDQGWVAVTYVYHCQIASVTFFELTEHDSIRPRIDSGDRYEHLFTGDYPEPVGKAVDDGDELFLARDLPSDPHEAIDDTVLISDVVAYAVSDAFADRRLIREAGVTGFDPERTYLVLTRNDNYFEEDLGCAYGGILFCSSPLGE